MDHQRRILFVDDDQDVLDALRTLLRSQRRVWEMTFAGGGEEALAELARTRFDVVVSDMRMPRVDGATVLREVKHQQPQAVRLVLSGQTDANTALKTVFVAHQFLAKPCDAPTLRERITRACALNDLVHDQGLKSAAGDVASLPPAPGVYVTLTQVLAEPGCSIKDVAAVVSRDVGLAAKILQLVNSAFFGLPRKVGSIEEAATLLGTSTLKNIALGMKAFAGSWRLCPHRVQAVQQHSLLTAHLARRMFPGQRALGDNAFLAGLLHDIGHLVAAQPRGEAPAEEVKRAHLGALLLGMWGLPHPIMEAVAHHETPMAVEHAGFDLLDAVYVADALAGEELAPEAAHHGARALDLDYLTSRGVTADRIDGWRLQARELMAAGVAAGS